MTDAERYFFAAGAKARAAHAIWGPAKADPTMTVPFYLLVGFSIETVLKAVFLYLGGDPKVAKNDIKHDLPHALAAAKERGFAPDDERVDWLVESMAEVHRKHSFRYLEGDHELHIPDDEIALPVLDGLIAQAGQLLHPDRSRESWLQLLARYERRES